MRVFSYQITIYIAFNVPFTGDHLMCVEMWVSQRKLSAPDECKIIIHPNRLCESDVELIRNLRVKIEGIFEGGNGRLQWLAALIDFEKKSHLNILANLIFPFEWEFRWNWHLCKLDARTETPVQLETKTTKLRLKIDLLPYYMIWFDLIWW